MTVQLNNRTDFMPTNKSIEENCGVFGLVGAENASRAVFFALYALNHREWCSPPLPALSRL